MKVLGSSACYYYWALLAFFMAPLGEVKGANVACQEVRYKYSAQGMNVYDVPLTPQLGKKTKKCHFTVDYFDSWLLSDKIVEFRA